MTHDPATPISVEEMAHAFEDSEVHDVDLSIYAVEDWLVLALFWAWRSASSCSSSPATP